MDPDLPKESQAAAVPGQGRAPLSWLTRQPPLRGAVVLAGGGL
jgi:hypothetical protein